MARASSNGATIRYVLPVWWMTSCFHTLGPTGLNQALRCVSKKFAGRPYQLYTTDRDIMLIEFIRMWYRRWGRSLLSATDLFVEWNSSLVMLPQSKLETVRGWATIRLSRKWQITVKDFSFTVLSVLPFFHKWKVERRKIEVLNCVFFGLFFYFKMLKSLLCPFRTM